MMHYTLFGESHGPAVGVLLTDVPPGLPVDEAFIREQLLRRMGQGGLTTARQEKEEVHFLSGVYRGRTTGDPLAAVIYNGDVRSTDYDSLKHKPRPSHGDYTAAVRALGCNDPRGGGHTSGRLTAPLTVAGALAITYLKTVHIAVHADVLDEEALRARAAAAKADGDSVGGVIRCTVSGLPSGVISSCALASGMAIIRMAQSARAVSLRMICFMLYPPLQVNQGLAPMNRCV